MTSLDAEIEGAFSLAGVLLVFVAAYWSFAYPSAVQLLHTRASAVDADRERFRGDLARARTTIVGLAILTSAALLLLTPLTARVLRQLEFAGSYRTPRAGLLLVDLLLLAALVASILLVVRLSRRMRELA